MNKEVAEEYCDEVPAKLVADARLWHEVREAHQAIVQKDDSALVKDFHLVRKGGLEGLHVHQVDDHCGAESELDRELYPQEVSN